MAASHDRASVIRVYLLDDHQLLRRGLRTTLEGEDDIEVVGEAALAGDAEAQIPALRPDVAILDLRLPDGSGVDVCRAVRSRDPSISVLMLTTFDDEDDVVGSVLAGAAGYLLKDVSAEDLIAAIRRIAAGQSTLDPHVTTRVLERMRQGPAAGTQLSRLTEGERRVLDLVAQGLTNRQIASRTGLSEKTVKNYVSDILAKLGLSSRTQAAVLAVEHRTRSGADSPA